MQENEGEIMEGEKSHIVTREEVPLVLLSSSWLPEALGLCSHAVSMQQTCVSWG